jgi:hypothetical protein
MVPKQHSSGGKQRLGNISKQGDRYLRGLFVAGALSVIRYAKIHGTNHRPWLAALLARRSCSGASRTGRCRSSRAASRTIRPGRRFEVEEQDGRSGRILFWAGPSGPDEGEQIGVDQIRMRCRHAMGQSGIGF